MPIRQSERDQKVEALRQAIANYSPGEGELFLDAAEEERLAPIKAKAVRLINHRARSTEELRQRLLEAEFEPEGVEEVIDRCTANGMLDDAEFANEWVRQRETFGRPLATRQVVRHKIVDMATAVDVARVYTRAAIDRAVDGDIDVAMLSMAKNQAVEACESAVNTAVQLHGGMGYLRESEVERHFRDMRILGIGGGTTEIMKEIVAKMIGL